MENLNICRAEETDAAFIVENNITMAKEIEDRDLNPEQAQQGVQFLLHNGQQGFYLIAKRETQVIGQLMVTYEWSDWSNGLYWWLQSVYVLPEFRKQGVFRKLYDHVYRLAQSSSGVCGLRLYAFDTNQKAMHTYISVGMQRSRYVMFEREID